MSHHLNSQLYNSTTQLYTKDKNQLYNSTQHQGPVFHNPDLASLLPARLLDLHCHLTGRARRSMHLQCGCVAYATCASVSVPSCQTGVPMHGTMVWQPGQGRAQLLVSRWWSLMRAHPCKPASAFRTDAPSLCGDWGSHTPCKTRLLAIVAENVQNIGDVVDTEQSPRTAHVGQLVPAFHPQLQYTAHGNDEALFSTVVRARQAMLLVGTAVHVAGLDKPKMDVTERRAKKRRAGKKAGEKVQKKKQKKKCRKKRADKKEQTKSAEKEEQTKRAGEQKQKKEGVKKKQQDNGKQEKKEELNDKQKGQTESSRLLTLTPPTPHSHLGRLYDTAREGVFFRGQVKEE